MVAGSRLARLGIRPCALQERHIVFGNELHVRSHSLPSVGLERYAHRSIGHVPAGQLVAAELARLQCGADSRDVHMLYVFLIPRFTLLDRHRVPVERVQHRRERDAMRFGREIGELYDLRTLRIDARTIASFDRSQNVALVIGYLKQMRTQHVLGRAVGRTVFALLSRPLVVVAHDHHGAQLGCRETLDAHRLIAVARVEHEVVRAQLARTGHRAQVEADIEREGLVSFFELLPHRIAFQRDVHLVGKRRFRHDALHDLHLAVFLVRIEHVDGIFADRLAVARKTVREARSKPLQARPFVFL